MIRQTPTQSTVGMSCARVAPRPDSVEACAKQRRESFPPFASIRGRRVLCNESGSAQDNAVRRILPVQARPRANTPDFKARTFGDLRIMKASPRPPRDRRARTPRARTGSHRTGQADIGQGPQRHRRPVVTGDCKTIKEAARKPSQPRKCTVNGKSRNHRGICAAGLKDARHRRGPRRRT